MARAMRRSVASGEFASADPLVRIASVAPWIAAEVRKRMAAEAVARAAGRAPGSVVAVVGVGRAVGVVVSEVVGAVGEVGVGGVGGGHERDNGRVVIVADVGTKGLVATGDPHDAAHLTRDPSGKLVPAVHVGPYGGVRKTKGARRREYPPSHINSAGIAIDSSFDGAWERARWIRANLGVELIGISVAEATARAVDAAVSYGGGLRKVVCENEDHEVEWSRDFRIKDSRRAW